MRKTLYAAAAAAFVMLPGLAAAQDPAAGAAAGATTGAVTGAIVGGPIGAAVGAGVGAGVGAAATDGRNTDRVIVEEQRSPSVTERTCVEGANSTQCVETRR
jgi:hypothetical protein